MAFNFNWSPLMADTSRARDMLTAALNKSPKPPIIVDDIIVTELNLGSTPPELEILEVGDLAEDRFRGIFKMSYAGDAFLTLKTKVQANPLKTYLSTKPDFASPQPLAASSGLTIPLQITLSDIRLSGFVILVFSKQKGITLVFRNDPLESLKVSSTFDSIPFVRDYLQKEIEGQLRVLFMEDLPAIIHRLSLRLWSTEYQELVTEDSDSEAPIDPLSTPPQDTVDAFGNPLSESQMEALSLESNGEIHASFSQKNILRLAALSESQNTLSLFTPSIRDAVFRAWAGRSDKPDSGAATPALTQGSLSRIHSTFGSQNSAASSVTSESTGYESRNSRPSTANSSIISGSIQLGANRARASGNRKPKKRVVDLRRKDPGATSEAVTPSSSAAVSGAPSVIPEENESDEDLTTPPRSPPKAGVRKDSKNGSLDIGDPSRFLAGTESLVPAVPLDSATPSRSSHTPKRPSLSRSELHKAQQATSPLYRSLSFDKTSALSRNLEDTGGILEQAWMLKMSQEIARKVQAEKDRAGKHATRPSSRRSKTSPSTPGLWAGTLSEDETDAPPAYVA